MPLTDAPRRLLAVALICAAVLAPSAGHAQDETADPAPSAQPVTSPSGDWLVSAYDAWEQGLAEPLPDSRLRLSLLDDGQLEGETACGRFNGGWSSEGEELFMGVAPSGNLGCAEPETAEAVGLSTALGAVTSWQATVDGVELRDALGSTRVVLTALTAGDPLGEWMVVRFRRPNGELREPSSDGPMSLVLDEQGSIEGSSGCQPLDGGYTLDGATITLALLDVEGAACEDPLARAGRQLLRALGEVVYWRQAGEGLTLLDGFDEPLVELVRPAETEE